MIEIHVAMKDQAHQELLVRELTLVNGGYREVYSHSSFSDEERNDILKKREFIKKLWVVDKAYQSEELCGLPNIIWLTDIPTIKENECFCYQPVDKIQRFIIKTLYLVNMVEEIVDQKRVSQFLYLYSPIGGVGVSTLAYELAVKLSQTENVLLISMDPYHYFADNLNRYYLSDFLFYWKTLNKVEIRDFCQIKENLHILHGPKYSEDLEIIKTEPKSKFLNFIQKFGYDRVIFDLSSSNMLKWCIPETKHEKLFVIYKPSGKWDRFTKRVDFKYQPISIEQGADLIIQILRRKVDADDIISSNYRGE